MIYSRISWFLFWSTMMLTLMQYFGVMMLTEGKDDANLNLLPPA